MDSPTPIPPAATQEMELEAKRRLDKVNPHLLRVTTEVQKMMMFHQYAAPVLAALAGGGEPPEKAATEAAKYADAMLELVRVRDAAAHAQAAEHFDVTPQAIAPTQEEARRAIDMAIAPVAQPTQDGNDRPVARLLGLLDEIASRAEALPGGEEIYNFTKWLNDELIRVSEDVREDDRHERRNLASAFEHLGHVYSLLSLVRHRHLPVGMDDLKRDIDAALGPAETALKPWWAAKMKRPAAQTEREFIATYAKVVLKAKALLAIDNLTCGPGWPAGQTWGQLSGTSKTIYMERARKELGVDSAEFLAIVRKWPEGWSDVGYLQVERMFGGQA